MDAPNKIYLSKLVIAGIESLDKPISDSDVEYIRKDALIGDAPLPEDTVLFNKGVEEGRRLAEEEQADLFTIVALDAAQRAKEQMMKAAVEGEVVKDWDNNISVKTATISGFKFGDKVRVIVLPKED